MFLTSAFHSLPTQDGCHFLVNSCGKNPGQAKSRLLYFKSRLIGLENSHMDLGQTNASGCATFTFQMVVVFVPYVNEWYPFWFEGCGIGFLK